MSIKSKVFAATATLTLVGGLSVAGLLPADAAVLGAGSHMTMSSQEHGHSDTSPCGHQGGNRQGGNRQGENWQGENWQGENWQGENWQGKNWQGKNWQGKNWQGERGRSSYQQVQYQQQSYFGGFYRGRPGQQGGLYLHGLRSDGPC